MRLGKRTLAGHVKSSEQLLLGHLPGPMGIKMGEETEDKDQLFGSGDHTQK